MTDGTSFYNKIYKSINMHGEVTCDLLGFKEKEKMKKVLTVVTIGFLCFSMCSIFTPRAKATGLPPVAYWRFDEGSGATAYDSSGNGNTGVLVNGPQWIDGKVGKALKFDGIDDYVLIPHSSSLDISGNQMTVEYWMRLSIDWQAGMNTNMGIYTKGDAWVGSMTGGSGAHRFNLAYIFPYPETNKNSWTANVWYHIADVYDGNHIRMYINGMLDKAESVTGSIPRSTLSLVIGSQVYFGWPWAFNGTLDELAIYNYARTPEEIWNDYQLPTADISAQYSSFVSAWNNYKQIFGQNVAIGQTVNRNLSGAIDDPPAHYQWHSWAGQTYPNLDGFSIRIETIQPDYVYKIIGMGQMAGSQPSASGWVQVNSPFKIEQVNYVENWTDPGGHYVQIYVNSTTGHIDFSAKWYNWPALIDAPAFKFAITIAKPGGTLPPFSYDTTRAQASYDYDTNQKRVAMFGGVTHWTLNFNPDVWTFDPLTSQWNSVSANSGPIGRIAASMSYNPIANDFLVFGGWTISGEASDTWAFRFTSPDAGTWTQIPVAGPSARGGAPMIYDSKNNLFVLFGGERYVYSLGDTWVFNPSTSSWSDVTPSSSPPQRARAAMAFDAKTGKTLLFGGLNKAVGSLLNDTWLYDAATNTWQQAATATAPSTRQYPSLTSDGDGAFYLFGGWRIDANGGSQYCDDMWKFDMMTMQWTQLTLPQTPLARSQSSLMNLGDGKLVLMNGWRDSPLGDFQLINISPNAYFDYSPLSPKTGETVTFNATLSTPKSGTIQWYYWDFGDTTTANETDPITTHSFASPATYNVTLKIGDSEGCTDTTWQLITVVASMIKHDIAILSVTPNTPHEYAGRIVNITVVVRNNGEATETFNVMTYRDSIPIGTVLVTNLGVGENKTITFQWNTTGLTPCHNWTISAQAPLVGDINPSDNTLVDGHVKIKMWCDVNADGIINILDIVATAIAYGSTPNSSNWNPQADVNQPFGHVDILDIVLISSHYGQRCP